MSELKVKKTNAPALVETRTFKRGACVHATGDRGQAWRVLSGSVRLDTLGPDGLAFASLALAGDVIGAEALVGGHYTFHARALTPCVLAPWKEPKTSLLGLFTATQRRAADLMALRGGRAADRVAKLVQLLGATSEPGQSGSQIVMPRLRDVADITDLTIETVSRVAADPARKRSLPHHAPPAYPVRSIGPLMAGAPA